jgi:hypothetical protein
MPCYCTTLPIIPVCQQESTFIAEKYSTPDVKPSPRDWLKYSASAMRPCNGTHDSESHTTASVNTAPHSPSLRCKTSWKTLKPKSCTARSRHERRNTGKKRNGCKLCRVYQSMSAPMRAFTNNAPTASLKSRRGSPSPCMCHKRNHHQHPLPAVFSHHPCTLPDNLARLQQNLFLCHPAIHLPIAVGLRLCNTPPHLRTCTHHLPCLCPTTSLCIAHIHCLYNAHCPHLSMLLCIVSLHCPCCLLRPYTTVL